MRAFRQWANIPLSYSLNLTSDMDKIDTLIDIGNAILRALNEMKERDEIPMTRQQAAVYLGVSLTTIDNYRKQGRIRQVVKDGIVGYLPSDLKQAR